MPKKGIKIVCMLAAVVAAFSIVPLAASADRDRQLVMGIRLNFTSPTHADGTFAACCAVNDSGAAQADVTSFTPRNNKARFEATETLTGAKGTITLALRGTTGPLDSPNHIARGKWKVVTGTGTYAGLRGRGKFTAVTNQATGALTGINQGKVRGGDD